MPHDENLYRKLRNGGLSHGAAVVMANTDTDNINGAAVATPTAMTAPATMNAAYTQAEVQALRTDVANTRTALNNLLTSLRNAGVIAP